MRGRILTLLVIVAVIGLTASAVMAQEARRDRSRRERSDNQSAGNQSAENQQQGDPQNSNRDGRGNGEGRSGDRRRGERGGDRGPGFGGDRGPGFGGDRGPGFGGDRGDDRGGSWRDRFSRGGPPREITPEDRERFYSGAVERYMERYGRNYELNDEQKQQVRARLEELKTQQRAHSEQHWSEFQSLRQEFGQMRESGQFDPQKAASLRQRFEALRADSPLFNDDRVVGEVEKLLPAEQVERGRANRQAERAEWDQRREERRREWEQRRAEGEGQGQGEQQDAPIADGQPPVGGGMAPPPPGGPDGSRWDRGRSGRDWRDRRGRDGDDDDRGRRREGASGEPGVQVAGVSGQQGQLIPENPIGPWEQYVRDFSRQYRLDATQQGTAESVLREVKERRTAYELSHRTDFDQARQIESSTDREKRLGDLNRPIVSMFEELKTRLQRIPSSAQRQMAGVRPTTSRPANTTTRPARDAG